MTTPFQVPHPDFARCDAFWARQESDRPLLAGWVGSYEASQLYPVGLSRLPAKALEPADIDFELFREDYERLFADHKGTGADVPWAAFPLMVVPWLEAICGCPIQHRDGNIWAEPWLEDYDRLEEKGLRLDHAWLDRLVAFTRWLVDLSAGRFPVALSLLRGPMDVLAAMRGAQRLVFDFYDRPGPVARLLDRLATVWVQAVQAQLAQIRPFAGGYSFSVQTLWARRPGGWFQEDAIAYSSPRFYRRLSRDPEARLSQALPLTGIHLHSPALFTVDDLVEMPDLDVIEVNLDVVGLRIPEMIPRFQQILARKRLFVWGALTAADLKLMRDQLPARGLALQLMGDTPEQVRTLLDQARAIWRSAIPGRDWQEWNQRPTE